MDRLDNVVERDLGMIRKRYERLPESDITVARACSCAPVIETCL
jgi:hypothetical protein